jgi:chemotaxis protein methyltransferase WspC
MTSLNTPNQTRPTSPPPATTAAAAEELLQRWIGLDPTTIGSAAIQRAVRVRMTALGLDDMAAFTALALRDSAERDQLVEEIVVAESWFFRDRQVFDFVRRFACTLAALPHRQPVRILSVPCASGEEPYSVAMDLLDAGLAPAQFAIDAVDVSHASLGRARQGSYSANAFRNADLSFRDRWFRSEGGVSVLDETVRRCVHFAWGNLLEESLVADTLHSGRGPYDVIFCRNLLIYLTPAARGHAEQSLSRLLKPDGVLVLGAAEPPIMKGDWIPAGDNSIFALRRGVRAGSTGSHPHAVAPPIAATRRRAETAAATKSAVRRPEAPVAQATPVRADTPARADTATPAEPLPLPLDDVLQAAGAMANARRFSDALAFCEEQGKRLGPSPELFFLMGMLHQSAGDLDRAEGCFHKTLYLDGSHEEALLALALLAAQRGDAAMAANYRQSATRALARKGAS